MTRAAVVRCFWARDPLDVVYHDREWGMPVRDDRRLFEFLLLEGAQAGLSWVTILRKRAAYRRAFADFDPHRVARFGPRDVRRLLADAGIVRNRAKIAAAVANARAFLAVVAEHGSFASYLWRFVGGRPLQGRRRRRRDVPAETELSRALSADLRRRGFRFVGPTICYAFMQAVGLVNDHTVDCFRYRAVARLGRPSSSSSAAAMRRPAEVPAAARLHPLEAPRPAGQRRRPVHPGRRQASREPAAHEPRRHREHERRLQLAGVPLVLGPRTAHQRPHARIEHRIRAPRARREPRDQHAHATASQPPPGARDRAQMVGVRLVVGQHHPPKAVAPEPLHDLHDHPRVGRDRQRHRAAPRDRQRADAVRQRGRQDRSPAGPLEMRGDAASQLLRSDPVDRQRQVRPMLLDRPQRQQDDAALIARNTPRLRPRQLRQCDHAGSIPAGVAGPAAPPVPASPPREVLHCRERGQGGGS